MPSLSLDQLRIDKKAHIEAMKNNATYVYPTDSLYGIGALFSQENIQKIGNIKQRDITKKMNIIAPGWDWIENNFIIHNKDFLIEAYTTYHAITFILEPKDKTSSVAIY
jgi:tRNA A37 threonylcarbamoyladenosine synthetase subunit TsaC/SUA5/YrdC